MATIEDDNEPSADHRARAARTKRLRTRARLLGALLDCYPRRELGASAIVDDVIGRAGVSRATFYKHFDSVDDAIDVLGAKLSEEMIGAYGEVYWPIDDPVLRVATGLQLFLCRSVIEPGWGAFVSHLDRLTRDHSLIKQMRLDLENGAKSGYLRIPNMDVAIDAVIGAKAQAIKQIVLKDLRKDYILATTSFLLQALGVEQTVAHEVAVSALSYLEDEAPKALTWWRPL